MVTWTGAKAQTNGIEGLQATENTGNRPPGVPGDYVFISGDKTQVFQTNADYLRQSDRDIVDENDV